MDKNEIRKLFDTHGLTVGQKDVWTVQTTPVIKHQALERLAAKLEIRWSDVEVLRAERDEAVIKVTGMRKDGFVEWSIGEALIGVNYRVSGKQAAYVYAMAEKRAKDRVIIKLAGLYGAYSEDEADDFSDESKKVYDDASTESKPATTKVSTSRSQTPKDDGTKIVQPEPDNGDAGVTPPHDPETGEITQTDGDDTEEQTKVHDPKVMDLIKKIRDNKTINAVTDLMLHADTQKILNDAPTNVRDEVRDLAKARLVELGWPTKKAQ